MRETQQQQRCVSCVSPKETRAQHAAAPTQLPVSQTSPRHHHPEELRLFLAIQEGQ